MARGQLGGEVWCYSAGSRRTGQGPGGNSKWLHCDASWCEGLAVFIPVYGSLELELAH